jgi:hypothetical protein
MFSFSGFASMTRWKDEKRDVMTSVCSWTPFAAVLNLPFAAFSTTADCMCTNQTHSKEVSVCPHLHEAILGTRHFARVILSPIWVANS